MGHSMRNEDTFCTTFFDFDEIKIYSNIGQFIDKNQFLASLDHFRGSFGPFQKKIFHQKINFGNFKKKSPF